MSAVKTGHWFDGLRGLLAPSETKTLATLSVVVGATAGVAAFIFINLVRLVEWWARSSDPGAASFSRRFYVVLLPALGGLVSGWLVHRIAPAAKGTGTAEVIYDLRRKGGHIPARVTWVKALASAATIGTAGSAGPEGPVIQIGAGVGSMIARWQQLPAAYARTLVAAGAAAGVAAVFNAPIASVMFALEVLGLEFSSPAFAMVVLATVVASCTSRLLLGGHIFFTMLSYKFNNYWELPFYLLLGLLAAPVAKAFSRTFLRVEEGFEQAARLSPPLRTMLGGLMVGLLGLSLPEILGGGHETISRLFASSTGQLPWAWYVLILLFVAKIAATSLTLGSGGSGGILIPALFVGAMLGGVVGQVANYFLPTAAAPAAYALVGMGAVFAGMTHAAFTSIILLFEITNDYGIILPVMFAVGVCLLIAHRIDPESLDGVKLLRKGVRHFEKPYLSVLDSFTVEDVMVKDAETIPENLSLADLTRFIKRSPHTGFPVVNAHGKLVGLLTYEELHQTFSAGDLPETGVIARDVMRSQFPVARPGEPLTEAMRRMDMDHADRIVVVSADDPRHVIGIITKGDILRIYSTLLKYEVPHGGRAPASRRS